MTSDLTISSPTTATAPLLSEPAGVEADAGDAEGDGADLEHSDGRVSRRKREREQRRTLYRAVLICAGVPIAVLLTLWRNLAEPFWYNEQWRAYYIANPGNWFADLKSDGAPFPLGWYFLERVTGYLFGSTELALRIPTAVFLPLGCVLLMFLARQYMPTSGAVIVALVGTFTGTLVSYALQLSEYQIDASAVLAILLLHQSAGVGDRPGWRSPRAYLVYGGIAVACLFSTPAVFIAGPLLLLDAVRLLRRRSFGPQLVCASATGLIILAHLQFFVVPQSYQRTGPYWDANFLPHHGVGGQIAFVWDGLAGFVTGIFTGSAQGQLRGFLLGRGWMWALSLAFGVLLCVGIAVAARTARGRMVLFVVAASQVLTLAASYERYWPFGFVRTNFYLVPLLMLLAGIGGYRVWAFAVSRLRASAADRAGAHRRVQFGAAVVVCVFVAAGVVFATLAEVGAYRQIRSSPSGPQYGEQIGSAVATVQRLARPGNAVVVAGGGMTWPGWRYYGYEYDGKAEQTGHQISLGDTVFEGHGSPSISRLVSRLNARKVFLYIPDGTTGPELVRDAQAAAKGRVCRQVAVKVFKKSGNLITLSCT
jgi:hypothetical protein